MTRFYHFIIIACFMAVALVMDSCTMIQDSVDDCPTGLYVRFVYDYNTARADMMKDHVGYVRLYVYDEQGQKVAERSVWNSPFDSPLSQYGYTMHFNPAELRPGRYRLQAIAMQRDYEEALASSGANYRLENAVTNSEDLRITLDHEAEPIPGTAQHLVNNSGLPLDTLWHTLKVQSYDPIDGKSALGMHRTVRPYSIYPIDEQLVTVTDNMATYATVSLIRDTKHLNITLRQIDFPDNIFHEQYEVVLLDNNATVMHDNSVAEGDSLRYTPYAEWTSRFTPDGVIIDDTTPEGDANTDADSNVKSRANDADNFECQRTAHYNIMFNRLMYNRDADKSASLMVRNRETNKVVAHINLPYMLAEGRAAYELYNYSPQEYLDREYDYHLNFFLKGDSWAYCDIVVNVLSWSKRKQHTEL